jgi:hypothetical protein
MFFWKPKPRAQIRYRRLGDLLALSLGLIEWNFEIANVRPAELVGLEVKEMPPALGLAVIAIHRLTQRPIASVLSEGRERGHRMLIEPPAAGPRA